MAYLGLVPSERSTGEQVWRGSITKAGNPRARRVLVEGAWTYRYPARLSRPLQVRQESLPTVVRASMQALRKRRVREERADARPATLLVQGGGLNFTDTPPRGKPLALKAAAVLLYVSGLSMNRTAQLLGVST